MNVLRVKKYTNNSRLKQLARDNMPFMGLEIHGLEEIKLDPNMPHTSSMKQKGIRIKVSSLKRIKTKGDILKISLSLDHRGLAGSPVRPPRPCHGLGLCKLEHKGDLGHLRVGSASCRRISTRVYRRHWTPKGSF